MLKTTALLPWYGCNRLQAARVGKILLGCEWVGIPFAGGMSEIPYIKSNVIVANDLHRHAIFLAEVVKHPVLGAALIRRLRRNTFHTISLKSEQDFLKSKHEWPDAVSVENKEMVLRIAEAYFTCAWMSRSGAAGTKSEFDANMSIRWKSGGGDSAVRYQSAIESLIEWKRIFQKATFVCMDAFKFLEECRHRDVTKNGIYCDCPFPDVGKQYKHQFQIGGVTVPIDDGIRQLAGVLTQFRKAKVVLRFYAHPLIEELFPPGDRWQWIRFAGRDQHNNADKQELLIVSLRG